METNAVMSDCTNTRNDDSAAIRDRSRIYLVSRRNNRCRYRPTGVEQYVVKYEDDDSEDLDADEFTNYLLIWGKAVAQKQKGVPPFSSHMYDAQPTHDRDSTNIAKNLINEIESMVDHDDGIPASMDQKYYDHENEVSAEDPNEK